MPKTFEFQEKLKSLPLSNLDEASENFLDWVKPLLTQEEFEQTKNTLEDFILKDGITLHKKLEEYSQQNENNWLAPLWREMYLDIREPVVIDVNYFIKPHTKHLQDKYKSEDVAALIIYKLMDIYESICNESFEPEMIKTTPLCMSAYKEMFKATRIPKLKQDEYIVKAKTLVSHIVIMYKNHMFKLNLNDEKGKRYSFKTISNTIKNLMDSKLEKNTSSIGAMTTAYRDEAALLLEEITSNNTNSENFELLQEALFVVCIDENSKDLYDFGMSLIGTNEDNRYFDKNLQLIFNQKGDFGFNIEHTGADAGTWINIINMVNEELKVIDDYVKDDTKETIKLEQLNWELTPTIKSKLDKIKLKHKEKVEDLAFGIINMDFGNNKIKELRYSPDAFLHLALQLAQYRTYGSLRSTYEAVSTRIYLKGRTECNRPISMEVLDFVKEFDKTNNDTKKLKELMGLACQKHTSRIKDCLGSKGVERYFFALKDMYVKFKEELNIKELPEFFNDEGYKKLTYSFISTSRIESKYFELCGFGPVVPDGYGFWYNLLADQININLISRKSVNEKDMKVFKDSIEKSLKDLVELASKDV